MNKSQSEKIKDTIDAACRLVAMIRASKFDAYMSAPMLSEVEQIEKYRRNMDETLRLMKKACDDAGFDVFATRYPLGFSDESE